MLDTAILIFLLLAFLQGLRYGFLKALSGPLFGVAGVLMAFFYYQKTESVTISFLIAFLTPWLLSLILKLLLWDETVKPSWTSRWCGALFSLTWQTLLIMSFLIALTLFPDQAIPEFARDILNPSFAYRYSQKVGQKVFPGFDRLAAGAEAMTPQTNEEESAYQEILRDPEIQKLFADPEIQEYIYRQDIQSLIQNEKFRQIVTDPQTAAKFLQWGHILLKNKALPSATAENYETSGLKNFSNSKNR